jgi:hypothetical protein
MSTVSNITSLPQSLNLNILSFLGFDEIVKTTDKINKLFHQLSSHDFLWKHLTLSISDNISCEKDQNSGYLTYHIGKNNLSVLSIWDKLNLPLLTSDKIQPLSAKLQEFLAADPAKIMGNSDLAFDTWSPTQHKHIQMLSSVYDKVMKKKNPSELEITKSCLLDAVEGCLARQYSEVTRLFLAFVAPSPYNFNFKPFSISQNKKQITLREIISSEFEGFAPVHKEVICSTWKQVYKSAMQHFFLIEPLYVL